MEGQLNGAGEMVPGQRALEGTDLDIAYNLHGEDLILRVNKGGVLVFRVQLKEAVPELLEARLLQFNSMAPDLCFRICYTEEGLRRMLVVAGLAEAPQPAGGFFRRLLGWS